MDSKKKRKHLSKKNFDSQYGTDLAQAQEEFRKALDGTTAQPSVTCLNDLFGSDGELHLAPDLPRAGAIDEFGQFRIVNMLRTLGEAGYSEPFKFVLLYLLGNLGIEVPNGALTTWKKDPGAPRKLINQQLRARWVAEGRPEITDKLCGTYAALAYPDDWKTSRPGGVLRKQLINRVRTRLLQYEEEQSNTKSPASIP